MRNVQHTLAGLPPLLTRWIGYRARPPPKQPPYIIWIWSFIASFGAVAAVQAIYDNDHLFIRRGVPSIVASFAASAVLVFGAIEAPLAQPRGLVGGHIIGSIIGVCAAKLFLHLPTEERFMQLQWLASSLAVSVTIVLMQMADATHPPGGATALVAVVDPDLRALGWYYIPIILLTAAVFLGIALFVNNIQRRYPVYWIKPDPPPSESPMNSGASTPPTIRASTDIEKGPEPTGGAPST